VTELLAGVVAGAAIGASAGQAGAVLTMHWKVPGLLPPEVDADWPVVKVYAWAMIGLWVIWEAAVILL
jgi:hypothetical protein